MDLALNNLQSLICHKTQPTNMYLGNRRFEMANVLDSDILGREFELQSRYYIYFRGSTLRKAINLPL